MNPTPLLCLLVGLITVPLLAETPGVPSRITAVTVYPDRARVTREAAVTTRPGDQRVEITGLPAGLDDSSVRVGLLGLSDVKLAGIEVRLVDEPRTEADTTSIEEAIQSLRDQRTDLEDARAVLQERSAFLESLRREASDIVHASAGTNATSAVVFQTHYTLYATETAELKRKARELERQVRALDQTLAKEHKRLADARPVSPPATKKAVVVLQSKGAASGRVTVSYVMGNASWQPLYDARCAPDSGQVELGYFANVQQSTGENWNGVRLALSTARPNVGARLGELTPWRLDFARPDAEGAKGAARRESKSSQSPVLTRDGRFASQWQQNSVAANGFKDDLTADAPAAPKPDTFALAEVQSLGASAVFDVAGTADIPSDGNAHRSTVRFLALTGTAEYVAIPKLQPAAFLKIRTRNDSALPLLPGEVSVFRGDDFVGKSFVRLVATGADFDLWLGVDDNIKVARKETKRYEAEGGLLTKTRNVTRAYELEVVNFKSAPVRLTLADQLPVSQTEKLVVNADWQGNAPTRLDKDAGKAEWTFDLKPRDKRTVAWSFTAELPPGSQIEGL